MRPLWYAGLMAEYERRYGRYPGTERGADRLLSLMDEIDMGKMKKGKGGKGKGGKGC